MKEKVKLAAHILELLGEGFSLKFERNKRGRQLVHERCDKIWYSVDRKQLYRTLDSLRLQGVIKTIQDNDGYEKVVTTDKRYAYSLKKQFDNLGIATPRRWDKKWRLVLFDIPETDRAARNALRRKLKELGFIEFQQSVFVFPYPCSNEINFVINFLHISDYVYCIEAPISLDNKLRKHFKL